jgi:acetolactate synthase I/II/III large subunit
MVRSHVPVVVIVINIGVLGYQKDAETVKFGRSTTACQLSAVSHAEIARASRCNAIRGEAPGDLAPALRNVSLADRRDQRTHPLHFMTERSTTKT